MAKVEPIKIPVEIDFAAASAGFESMARLFAGWASSAQTCADALKTLAKTIEEES